MAGIRWKQKEKDWIVQNAPQFQTVKEAWEAFNKVFPPRGLEGFKTQHSKLHLSRKINIGKYSRDRVKEESPIGTEIKTKTGIVYVKIKESTGQHITGYQYPYWAPKQRKVYEDHFGPIPKNHFIVFLNKDTTDFDINNLYCINRSILAIMNKNKWFTTSREHTLAAIKLCELMREL